jgi:acetyl-CoA acetyltransferase
VVDQPLHIVGVAETPLGKVPDHTEMSMVAVAAREALAEAGLTLRDVDALFVNYMGEEGSVQVGEYLGIQPRYGDSSDLGGGSFEAFIHHAMLALQAGHCDVALIAYASRQRSRRNRSMMVGIDDSLGGQFEAPYGLPLAIGHYALIASRHMHQFGTTPEQLAAVAVTARRWAAMNPKAWSREPLTVDDVLASAPISEPFHKLDCCLRTDGGGAVVVTRADRAMDAAKPSVPILGAGESHTHWNMSQMRDFTVTCARESGQAAFRQAGIAQTDVDFLEPYDNFTSSVILQLEDLGFCDKGDGGPFVAEGNLAPGGSLPAMTMGGGLSYCHPGALGILLLIEAVRQLRGEAGERQLPDPQIGVVSGIGGISNSAAATVVLGRA